MRCTVQPGTFRTPRRPAAEEARDASCRHRGCAQRNPPGTSGDPGRPPSADGRIPTARARPGGSRTVPPREPERRTGHEPDRDDDARPPFPARPTRTSSSTWPVWRRCCGTHPRRCGVSSRTSTRARRPSSSPRAMSTAMHCSDVPAPDDGARRPWRWRTRPVWTTSGRDSMCPTVRTGSFPWSGPRWSAPQRRRPGPRNRVGRRQHPCGGGRRTRDPLGARYRQSGSGRVVAWAALPDRARDALPARSTGQHPRVGTAAGCGRHLSDGDGRARHRESGAFRFCGVATTWHPERPRHTRSGRWRAPWRITCTAPGIGARSPSTGSSPRKASAQPRSTRGFPPDSPVLRAIPMACHSHCSTCSSEMARPWTSPPPDSRPCCGVFERRPFTWLHTATHAPHRCPTASRSTGPVSPSAERGPASPRPVLCSGSPLPPAGPSKAGRASARAG